MSRRRSLLLLVLVLGVLAGCQETSLEDSWQGSISEQLGVTRVNNPAEPLWQVDPGAALQFELEQVFGVESEPADALLSGTTHLAVDGAGSVYVLAGESPELVAFAPDGSVRFRRGRQGEGPGEFLQPSDLAWDGSQGLWLLNQQGSRLELWDRNGNMVRSGVLDGLGLLQMTGVTPAGLGRILLRENVAERVTDRYHLVTIGPPARLEASFTVDADPPTDAENFGGGVRDRLEAGHVYVGSYFGYRLRVFDARGNLDRIVDRPVDTILGPGLAAGQGDGSVRYEFGGVDAPLVLDDGRWLVNATWPTNVEDPDEAAARFAGGAEWDVEFSTSLDLFDDEGRFLTSLVEPGRHTPSIGEPRLVGPDGKLYTTVDDPFPQVRRYRVVLTPPDSAR